MTTTRTAALVVLASMTARCAMSPQAFGRLSANVATRNAERYRMATERFIARGYRFVDDESRDASTDDGVIERCRRGSYVQARGGERSDSPEGTVVVRIATPQRENEPSVITELRVDESSACSFFAHQHGQMDGVAPDGTAMTVFAVGEGLRVARDPHGALVFVGTSTQVVCR